MRWRCAAAPGGSAAFAAAPVVLGEITGFVAGDTIELAGQMVSRESFAAGTLSIYGAGGLITALALGEAAGVNTGNFSFSSDGGGNSFITTDVAPCFVAGTRIRTPSGAAPVEALRIGDDVVTAFTGRQRIKWIGRRDYDGRFIGGSHLALPVCIKAGAMAEAVPSRDLWVSADHAICEGGVLVHAWRLANGVSIVQANSVERVSYFHIELDAHGILFAEDCPAESFRDAGCRARFQNAAQFHALYGDGAPTGPCLPLLQGGFHLRNIQLRLNARAGIRPSARRGALRGHVDEAGPVRLRGWAQDEASPEHPVALELCAGADVFGLVLANEYRPDLRAAGLGSGCHGFTCQLPRGLTARVTLRRASDLVVLASTAARAAA